MSSVITAAQPPRVDVPECEVENSLRALIAVPENRSVELGLKLELDLLRRLGAHPLQVEVDLHGHGLEGEVLGFLGQRDISSAHASLVRTTLLDDQIEGTRAPTGGCRSARPRSHFESGTQVRFVEISTSHALSSAGQELGRNEIFPLAGHCGSLCRLGTGRIAGVLRRRALF